MLDLQLEHKIKEALRYMGYKRSGIDEESIANTEASMKELEGFVRPKYTYKVVDISIDKETNAIDFSCFNVSSKNLSRNLGDCQKAVVFAATLGTNADLLIRRYAKSSITKSVVVNACASALIEEVCDNAQKQIEEQIEGYFRPRFSPGYGDFDLKHQTDIINLLNAEKAIGLTLSDTLVLLPEKSVTAVMGISGKFENCHKSGCEVCAKTDCEYRR